MLWCLMAICNLQSPCYECFFWQLATCHGSDIPGYPRCLVPAEKVVSMHRHRTCRGIDHIQLASTASWGSARSWERWEFDTLPFMLGSRSAGIQGRILGYDMLVPKILELLPKKLSWHKEIQLPFLDSHCLAMNPKKLLPILLILSNIPLPSPEGACDFAI